MQIKMKISKVFIVMAVFVVLLAGQVFAATDDFEIGTQNRNNTPENSAKVGDQLVKPEKGWKRYDDSNSKIQYIGNWTTNNASGFYAGSRKATPDAGAKIKFNFVGSKIRLLDYVYDNRTEKSTIKIDGVNYTLNQKLNMNSSGIAIFYELKNLEYKEHTVEITNAGDGWLVLDAIDIDDNGEIKPYGPVQVSIKASSLELNKTTMDLEIGNTDVLTAKIKPDNTTNKAIKWTTSDSNIATVDSSGKVTAIKAGTAAITATTQDGSNLSASCNVTVNNKNRLATSITLNKTSLEVDVDNTALIEAIVDPDDATNKAIKWTTSDSNIATVDENGKVTAIKAGTATITATTQDGSNLSASCNVTVNDPTSNENKLATSITLNKTSLEVDVDKTALIGAVVKPDDATNKAVKWVSSDPSIAIVYSNGKVKGIKPGKVTITATTQDGSNLSASCEVTVKGTTGEVEAKEAKLGITMVSGAVHQYDLSMEEVDKFLAWIDGRAKGEGNPYYTFEKKLDSGSIVKEYIMYDKIESFTMNPIK